MIRRSIAAIVVVLIAVSLGHAAGPASPANAERIPLAPAEVEGSIIRLYQAAFDRAPDDDGLNYWVWTYVRGETLESIADGFVSSAEFNSVYGDLDDQALIEQLYENVLGRAGEPDGVSFWLDRLDGGDSRAMVLVGLAESPENEQRTMTAPPQAPREPTASTNVEAAVTRLYQATFLRPPDRAGLDYWTVQVADGTTLEAIAEGFVESSEFTDRYGDLDTDGFVDRIYRNVLDRPPEADGAAFWRSIALRDGRSAVLHGLAQSPEFAIRTGTPAYVAPTQPAPTQPNPSGPLPSSVLIIGDSILEGVRLDGVRFAQDKTVYDTEVGRQMSVLPARIDLARDAGPLPPVVVIHLGTNGWRQGDDALLTRELDQLDARSVILVDVFADRPWTGAANRGIEAAVARFGHVELVRWSTIAGEAGNLRSDGIHPTARGRAALARSIEAALRNLR